MHMQMSSFRRHNNPVSNSQPGISQIAAWAHHPEPHIDEEHSDAEDDNTTESGVNIDQHTNIEIDSVNNNDRPKEVTKATKSKRAGTRQAITDVDGHQATGKQTGRPDKQTPKRLSYQKSVKTIQPSTAGFMAASGNENRRTLKGFVKNNNNPYEGLSTKNMASKATRSTKSGFQTPMDIAVDMMNDKTQGAPLQKTAHTNLKRKQQPVVSRQKQKFGFQKTSKMSSIDFSQPALSPQRTTPNEDMPDESESQAKKTLEPLSRGTPRQQPITNFQLKQEQAKLMKIKQLNQTRMNQTAFGSSSILGKGSGQATSNVSTSYNQFLNEKNCSKHQSMIQKFESQCKQSRTNKMHANTSLQHKQNTGGSSSSKKQKQQSISTQQATVYPKTSIFVTTKTEAGEKDQEQQVCSPVPNCKNLLQLASSSSIKPFSMDGATTSPKIPNNTEESASNTADSPEKAPILKTRQDALHTRLTKTGTTVLPSTRLQKQCSEKMKNCPPAILTGASSSSTILQSHLRQLQSQQQSMSFLHAVTSEACGAETKQANSQKAATYKASASVAGPNFGFGGPPNSFVTKSLSSVKDNNNQGFVSLTANRGAAKKGYLRDNNGPSQTPQAVNQAAVEESCTITTEDTNKINRKDSKGKKKLSQLKGLFSAGSGVSSLRAKRGSTSTSTAYMTIDASKPSIKPQDSSTTLRMLHGPSSSKNTENMQQVKFDDMLSSAQTSKFFQQSTRQRTNTTLAKHSTVRQSLNNLTLQDLMTSSQPTAIHLTTSIKPSTKNSSTRGSATGKLGSQLSVGLSNSGAAGFKSSNLAKNQQVNTASRKQTASVNETNFSAATSSLKQSHLYEKSKISSRQQVNSMVNDKIETLASKAVEQKKLNRANGAHANTRNCRGPEAQTHKIRSHSTMKNHGYGTEGCANSSLLNLTQANQQYADNDNTMRQPNNDQNSLILSAVESKGTTTRGPIVESKNESKRTSIQPGSTQKQDWGLSDFEKVQYGDRCPRGYQKLSLLGKGGAAIVWLALQLSTGQEVALKQFPKPKNSVQGVLDPTAKIEIEMGRLLFSENSIHNGYSINPKEFPGILKIAKLNSVIEESKDVWLSYQVGGRCLTSFLFDVKGEFYKGERIYGVQHREFYRALKTDKQVLVDLIRMLAEVFDVLAMFRIVHADIKPDNILIDFDGSRLRDIKLIDFGSAFSYENPSSISATTPEYLAPEVLTYLERRAQNTDANGTNTTNLCRMQEPWSYDMWSMGAILLELLTGIPLWMSLKCRAVTQTGKQLFGMGIFGVQGRINKKIMAKQSSQLKNLQNTLKKYDCYGLDKDPIFMDLLMRMLDPNPISRISPIEVLEHPYIKNKV